MTNQPKDTKDMSELLPETAAIVEKVTSGFREDIKRIMADVSDLDPGDQELIGRLRIAAARSSEISRSMAEAKSLRQPDNPEGRTDLYMWPTPGQTIEGRAADRIEELARSSPPVPSDGVADLIDAVREAAARVCDRHIDIQLCRKLFGEGKGGAFAMASHLAEDIRNALLNDHPRVVAALSTIDTGRAREGWQPIETAPRDGTEFAMLDNNVGTATVGYWMEKAEWGGLRGTPEARSTWFPLATPTHWMPLPAPPALKDTTNHG